MSNFIAAFAAIMAGSSPIGQVWDFIAPADLSSFTSTAIGGGAAALNGQHGGAVRFSGVATTNASGAQLQIATVCVTPQVNGIIEYAASIKSNHADAQWSFGGALVSATLIGAPPTDGIWLVKSAGSLNVSLVVSRGGVTVTKALGAIAVNAVYQNWQVQVRGKKSPIYAEVKVYLNGNLVWDDTVANQYVNFPYDTVHAPFIAAQSGSALGTQTVDVDWFYFKASRIAS